MKTLVMATERERMKIGVISVTKAGDIIADKLKSYYDIDFYSKNNTENFNLKKITKYLMEKYKAIIFISSTGIAVRAAADFIKSKDIDPAVVVVDSSSKFVISLLSGHLGGANELTAKIASKLGAIPVITTATDNMGICAPDLIARENDLVIDNLKDAKSISSLLVNGSKVAFIDDRKIIDCPKGYNQIKNCKKIQDVDGIVVVTDRDNISYEFIRDVESLKLIRRDIVIGVGCRKNYDKDKMKNIILDVLKQNNIDKRSVKTITTVDIKRHEAAILSLRDYLNCDLKIWSREDIRKVQNRFSGSDFVEKTIGVRSVCEPCTYLSGGEKLTGKIKSDGMTVCIGKLRKCKLLNAEREC